jgi:hypothetical protein
MASRTSRKLVGNPVDHPHKAWVNAVLLCNANAVHVQGAPPMQLTGHNVTARTPSAEVHVHVCQISIWPCLRRLSVKG